MSAYQSADSMGKTIIGVQKAWTIAMMILVTGTGTTAAWMKTIPGTTTSARRHVTQRVPATGGVTRRVAAGTIALLPLSWGFIRVTRRSVDMCVV